MRAKKKHAIAPFQVSKQLPSAPGLTIDVGRALSDGTCEQVFYLDGFFSFVSNFGGAINIRRTERKCGAIQLR